MKRTVAGLAAVAVLLQAAAADRTAMIAEAARLGFDAAEEKWLRASAEGDGAATAQLAELYAAHHLWPETLAVLARLEAPGAGAETLRAEALYRLGRDERLVALSPAGERGRAFVAMAHVRRGSYAEALAAFAQARAPGGFAAEFDLSLAEAALATGDAGRAKSALERADRLPPEPEHQSRRLYLGAQLLRLLGEEERARVAFRRLAERASPDDWSMRARIAIAPDDETLSALSLAWKSGPYDRDLLSARASRPAGRGGAERALRACSELASRFPESDAALRAQEIAADLLQSLFDDAGLSAEKAARLFFENVAFAPPGRDGDALIRRAADRLQTLGLHAEAAALIDHQVFKRLRGAERSRIAADLAALYLGAGKPEAALASLRKTRIAGLDAETNARRRRLEAEALGAAGRHDAALALLETATAPEDRRLRAALAWEGERWAQAASGYAEVFAETQGAASRDDREAALRAATAFLLAGDRAGYRNFLREASPRLKGAREEAVIRSLGEADGAAFLDRFMETYRALYDAPGQS